MYAGRYELIEARRANDDLINIPHEEGFYPYGLTIEPESEGASGGGDDGRYSFYLKIGNNLRSKMTTTDNDRVSFGPVMSTMMMPPPLVFELERGTMQALEGANKIELQDNSRLLLISGSNGRLKFERK